MARLRVKVGWRKKGWNHSPRVVSSLAAKARVAVRAQREAEAYNRRLIQERCDAYLAGLFDQ